MKARTEKVWEQEPRIRLVAFNDIRLGTQRRDLVKELIPRTGLTVVWGPPKCGKSFWVFDLAMHVALGREYRGRRVHQGSVVYCAFEGATGLEARVEAFRQRFLSEEPDVPFFLEPARLDLIGECKDLIAVIERQLGERAPVLIVLDTLNRSLLGSESKDEDMGAYVAAADAIREAFGCAVIIVHHCGINGERPRGHTSLSGAVDAQLSVKRDGADNILVEVELMKDGPQGDMITSRLEVIEVGIDEDGDVISSCVIVPVEQPAQCATEPRLNKNQQTMFSILHDAGSAGLTTEDWNNRARDVGIGEKRKADLYDIRKKLTSLRLVRQFGERWIADR